MASDSHSLPLHFCQSSSMISVAVIHLMLLMKLKFTFKREFTKSESFTSQSKPQWLHVANSPHMRCGEECALLALKAFGTDDDFCPTLLSSLTNDLTGIMVPRSFVGQFLLVYIVMCVFSCPFFCGTVRWVLCCVSRLIFSSAILHLVIQ